MENYEKRGYLLENFRLFHLRTQGGTPVDVHYHEFCKLLLLISGQGSYYIDGQHYLLAPGDIVLVGSHCVHKPELSPEEPYERIIIYISPEYLGSRAEELLSLFSGSPVLRPREPVRRQLFTLAAELERSLSQEGFGKGLLCDACLARLLVALGRCRENREDQDPSLTLPENRRVQEILRYLDDHLAENIDIDRLAETFFLSKYYMMHTFRKATGTTIGAYLTRRRLMLARKFMESGMSATDACYRCGFHSYSSFTRAYRKYCGTTPTGRPDRGLIREEDYE